MGVVFRFVGRKPSVFFLRLSFGQELRLVFGFSLVFRMSVFCYKRESGCAVSFFAVGHALRSRRISCWLLAETQAGVVVRLALGGELLGRLP